MQVKLRGKNGTGSTSAADAWGVVSAKTLITTPVVFAFGSSAAGDAKWVSKGAATMTIAAPGVITLNSHTLVTGDYFKLTTTGALPTGLVAGQTYYAKVIDANTFSACLTKADALAGNSLITTSGTQSGTHTLFIPGTGVQTIQAKLIDNAGNLILEDVELAGTTKVVSANPTCLRCIGLQATSQGSGGVAAGDIYCADTGDTWTSGVPQTPAKIFGKILVGQVEDQGGHFTIPKGWTGKIEQLIASFPDITTTAKYGYVEVQYKSLFSLNWRRYCILGVSSASNMSPFFIEAVPETIPEMTDIRIQYRQSAACEVWALVEMTLQPNTKS